MTLRRMMTLSVALLFAAVVLVPGASRQAAGADNSLKVPELSGTVEVTKTIGVSPLALDNASSYPFWTDARSGSAALRQSDVFIALM